MSLTQALLLSSAAVLLLVHPITGTFSSYDQRTDILKKDETCVSLTGSCFNTDECCTGLTCISPSDRGDLPETPGQCAKSKDLKTCSTVEDCYPASEFNGADVACEPLAPSDTNSGQRYCVHAPAFNRDARNRALAQLKAPRKHQAYARLLSSFAGLCDTDADCQSHVSNSPGVRLCCQQISQGRQGTRRICDRVTAVSVCIPSLMK